MTQLDRRTVLAALGLVSLSPVARAQTMTEWRTLSAMPWAAQEIYCAVSRGRIVVAGGLVGRRGEPLQVLDRTGLYDIATDRWSEGPRLPAPRHHPMIVADDQGRVYAIGGYGEQQAGSARGQWTSQTSAWTLDGDAWSPIPDLPQPQAETVGLAVQERLHLITGRSPKGDANGEWNDQGDVDTHRVWSADQGQWETLRPAPMARNSAAGAVLDGALWIAGGRTVAEGGTGRMDRYDPVADRWDTLAPIPRSEASSAQVGGGLAMVASGGRLVTFGGEWFEQGGGGVFAETWIYDPARDVWQAGPAMKTPRHGLAAAELDGLIYAIGGGSVVSAGGTSGIVELVKL